MSTASETFRFVNKPYADWLEMPRREILGTTMREVFGEETYATRKPLIDAAMAGERQFFAADLRPSDARAAGAAGRICAVDRPGRRRGPRASCVVVNDVTEQRVAERALQESEERFRRIANSAPVLMWVTRLDRMRDFVNDAYMSSLRPEDREEARTLDWRDAIHPDDVERIVAESIAGEASLQPFTLEARYRRHDGEYRWLRTRLAAALRAGRRAGRLHRRRHRHHARQGSRARASAARSRSAPRELALSEARFRAVFDTVLEVLVLMEPDGTIVELNRKEAPWRAAIRARRSGRRSGTRRRCRPIRSTCR